MAFDPTTPYALACLGDSTRSIQSLTILRQEEPAEIRVQNLVDLAQGWEVEMAEEEAERVVAEYDLVVAAQAAAGRGGAFSSVAAAGS